jgi:peptide/nickel transport system substrate-binding protein
LRNIRRLRGLVAVLSVVALLGAACGGGDGGGTGEGTTEEQRGQTESQVLGGEPFSASQGGVMKFASIEGPDYMDPGAAYTVTFFAYVARGVFRTLVTYPASTNLQEQNTLIPDLATDLGQPNEDSTEWTYTLKDGIRFGPALGGEDVPGVTGEEITADDIKYAIERQFIGSVGAQYPFYYEAIEGVKEFQSGKADEVSGITTDGDKSITFKLTKPLGDWDYRMAMPAATPVPKSYAGKFDSQKTSQYDQHVVASGPYYVETYTPSEQIVFKKNPQWDAATDEARRGYVDEVQWKMGFENDVCVQKVLDNDYDTAVDCDPEGPVLKEIVQTPELKERFFNLPIACTSYIFMNTTVEPFDDPKVRQAMNFLVDKQNQLKVLGGSFTGDVASSILPPGMVGHLPTAEYNPFGTPNFAGDVDKAKQLLAEAGLENGFDGKLLVVGDAAGAGPKQIESLRADLESVGFTNLEIKQLNYPDYYTQYYGVPRTNTAMGFSAWCEDWPSPVTFLEPLLYGPNILQQGNSNYAELDDPQVNKAIEEASAIPIDQPEAEQAWADANQLATETAPWIPVRWYLDRDVASTNVVGGYWHSYYTALDWVNVGVQ